MKSERFEDPWQKKVRNLSHLLIFSTALNVALGLSLALKHRQNVIESEAIVFQSEEVQAKSITSALETLFASSFSDLAAALEDKTMLQDGFSYRDFALATLINYHDLDIDRALSGFHLQERSVSFQNRDGGENFTLQVLAGLEDHHYHLIRNFIREHPWPQNPKGLFTLLKAEMVEAETSLVNTFFATPHFYAIYTMLHRLFPELAMEKVLLMLLEGSFEDIEETYALLQSHAATHTFVQNFFKRYITKGSSYACSIWIQYEGEELIRTLDDESLILLANHMQESSQTTLHFLKQLLCSVRKDSVRAAAAKRLYHFSGIQMPEPYNHQSALASFLPKLIPEKLSPVPAKEPKIHIVRSGDSLWKLARKYKTSIESIKRYNHLTSNTLRPGQEIHIPK